MTAALGDSGFQRRLAPRALSLEPRAPSIQGIQKLVATLDSSVAVWNSIHPPPARESITVREPGGVHFIEIEVSGIVTFESLSPTKPKCSH
jgi:hypothetical protein